MTIAEVSSASPSSTVTVSTAVMAPLASSVILDMGASLLDSGISGPAGVPALVGPLTCGVVDLDTVDPQDQDQDLVHTGYTRRSQTSNGCPGPLKAVARVRIPSGLAG